MKLGKTFWAIAEGYIPTWSHGPSPEMESHETVCILKAGERQARRAKAIHKVTRRSTIRNSCVVVPIWSQPRI